MNASSRGSSANASDASRCKGRVLVTGGTGFIGSAIVRLLAQTRPVAVLTRKVADARTRFERSGLVVEVRQGDVTDPGSLDRHFMDVDTVVQCVQFTGFPVEAPSRGLTFMGVDAAGTRAVVDAARGQGVRKIVYVSGVGADPHARQAWFRAKGLAEDSIRSSGLAFAIVRPSWTYGPGDRSLNRFVRMLRVLPGIFPQLGPGDQRLNPVFIEDVAWLVAEAATGDILDGETVEIGGPRILTLDDIIRIAMRVTGREKPIVHAPLAAARLAGFLLEFVPGQILSRDAVAFVTQSAIAESGEIGRLFPGHRTRSLEEMLPRYL